MLSGGPAFQGPDDLGEYAAFVNVGDQNHGGFGIFGHAKVNQIIRHQVHFGAGTGTFHDDEFIAGAEAFKGRTSD